MALYSDEGIVLRTAKLGEADRIITLFTRGHGKVRAVAKGVRRTKSRFGARLEPFMRVSLLLAEGRSLDNVSQAESIAAYAGSISGDYEAYRAANVICETLNDLVTTEHEPQPAQYQLVVGALHALAARAHHAQTICESYVLRALAPVGRRACTRVWCAGAPTGSRSSRRRPAGRCVRRTIRRKRSRRARPFCSSCARCSTAIGARSTRSRSNRAPNGSSRTGRSTTSSGRFVRCAC